MVRFKNRYITIEITPNKNNNKPLILRPSALYQAIQKKIQQMYGDFGVAAIKAGFNAKYCNPHTRIALIKTRHGPHKLLLNALPTMNDIGERLVSVNIIYVGATMKHCFLFIQKYQRGKLEKMLTNVRSETERKRLINAVMTSTPDMKELK